MKKLRSKVADITQTLLTPPKRDQANIQRPGLEILPPRILLSADSPLLDLLVPDKQAIDDLDIQKRIDELEIYYQAIDEKQQETSLHRSDGLINNEDTYRDSQNQAGSQHALVVIDERTPGYEKLLDDIQHRSTPGTHFSFLVLASEDDGVERISRELERLGQVDALHVLSHGDSGQLHLGNRSLQSVDLLEEKNSFVRWGSYLSESADILLYGCNLAATEQGRTFVDELARLTSADVAASDDRTGSKILGGDWTLEYRTGDIAAGDLLSLETRDSYESVLGTFTVVNTNDSGAGSLRQAIIDANLSSGADTINFDIDGGGPHIISLSSLLPTITEQVLIDGTTEGDFAANGNRPIVVIDGNGIFGDALYFDNAADFSEVRGLVIRDFGLGAVYIAPGADDITIAGNYLGSFDTTGADVNGQDFGAEIVYIEGARTIIGGSSVADRNVIGGGDLGVLVNGSSATGTQVSGNYIGVGVSGNLAVDISFHGVLLLNGATNITVGGVTAAHGNLIAGVDGDGVKLSGFSTSNNTVQNNIVGVGANGTSKLGVGGDGIFIVDGGDDNIIRDNVIAGAGLAGVEVDGFSYNTQILGNYIGTDATESYVWGSGQNAVLLENGVTSTIVGSTVSGEGNVLVGSGADSTAYNAGVAVMDTSTATIRGNKIYANHGIGIDLGNSVPDGSNVNDLGDLDFGGNNLQNWPELVSTSVNGTGDFDYELDASSLVLGTYTIDFYANNHFESGDKAGSRYLGSANIIGGGIVSNSLSGVSLAAGERVTLTATDSLGRTSEFSNYMVVRDSAASGSDPTDLSISSTANGGLSLNQDGGNDSYLIADDGSAILGGLTSLTVEVQLSMGTSPTFPHIFDYATSSEMRELSLLMSGDTVRVSMAGSNVGFAGDYSLLRDGEIHAVAMSWDSATGELRLYIDGEYQESITGFRTGYTLESGGTLVLGNDQDSVGANFQTTQAVNGTLYDFRIFDNVRTDLELASSFAGSLPDDEPNLVASWEFDALNPHGQVQDSVSGNNLTLLHIGEPGFTASKAELTLWVNENELSGFTVGSVSGTDPERDALIASLLTDNPDLYFNATTGKFYQYVDTGHTWTNAFNNAQATQLNGVAGQLVSINSAAENQQVVNILNDQGASQSYFLASDTQVEGEWRQGPADEDTLFWVGDGNGSRIDGIYENWSSSNPNNNLLVQDYAKIFASDGGWDDVDGLALQKSIIEFDANAVLSNAGPDGQQPLSYALVSQTVAGTFLVDSISGDINVVDGSLLNYETNSVHNLTIRVSDVDGNSIDRSVVVEVRNLVESDSVPTDLSNGIALNTDGGNDAYLTTVNPTSVFNTVSTELTLEAIFSIDENNTTTNGILSYANSNGDDHVVLNIEPTGEILLGIDGVVFVSAPATELLDGDLHAVAASWDSASGSVAIYVDGQLHDSSVGYQMGASIGGDGVFILGQDQDSIGGGFDSTQSYSGTLYDVRIWNNIRSYEEITLNYQHQFDISALPANLVANWQMTGFNGSNEVVDVVNGDNLSVGHASEAGFTTGTASSTLEVNENTADGVSVGYVIPTDPDHYNDIVSDGLFLQGDTGVWQFYNEGQSFGQWQVLGGGVDHTSQYASPLGGVGVELERGVGDPGGTIAQTLTTEVGREYQVLFAATGNFGGGDAVKHLRVSAGGVSQDFAIQDTGAYQTFSFQFTATSTTSELFLQGLRDTGHGAVVSDVRVLEIPEAISVITNNDPSLQYDATTGKFYRVVTVAADPETAQALSAADTLNGIGGQLVTIRSQHENNLIHDMVSGLGGTFHIGGTDATTEGTWKWIEDGAEADTFWIGDDSGTTPYGVYANFDFFEPDNGSGSGEDHASFIASSGYWSDVTTGLDNYITEWDAREVLSNYSFDMTNDAGGRFSIDSNTGQLLVADGSLLDYETATSHSVTVEVTDAAGNSYSELMTIEVRDLGGEPTQTLPPAQVIADVNETLTFNVANVNSISVSDDDPASDLRLQVALSVNNGTLTLSQIDGLSISSGSNGGTFMTIQGAESDINAALEGLVFTPDSNYSGAVTLQMTTSLGANLEGHYTFDGGNADDQSEGVTQHGALLGGATTVTDGTRGEVLSLDGVDDHVQINSLFGSPANVTLAAWVNLDTADTGGSEIISLGNNFLLRADDTSGVSAYFYNGSGFVEINSDRFIEGAGWNHVATTFDDDNNQVLLYLNGEEVASLSTSDSISYSLNTVTMIGNHGNGLTDRYFNGLIDDARIYNTALTAGEIVSLARDRGSVSGSVSITVNSVNDAPVLLSLDGSSSYIEGGVPVILDTNVQIYDQELTPADNFNEAKLELYRNGGANNEDVFSATGNLGALTQGGNISLSGVTIGTVSVVSGGALTLDFNSNATQVRIVETLQSIAYSNTSDTPSPSVQIDWTFSDGNTGAQGIGGVGQATGSTTVTILAQNDLAVANNYAASTNEDVSLILAPASNDTDLEGDYVSVVEFTQPGNGLVINNGDGTLTYSPDSNYAGSDSFDYVATDTGAGLQHYWALNGDATDLVGSANGALSGSSTVSGSFGAALGFDEIGDHVTVPDVSYNTEFSISFDFKADEINGSLSQFLYSHGDINSNNSINIFINEDSHGTDPNVLRTVVRDSDDTLDSAALEADISGIVGDGQWHTYTLTADAEGLAVYLDGVIVQTDTTRGKDGINPAGNLYFGARQDLDANQHFGGLLDSVQIFSRSLNPSEVSSLASLQNQATVNLTINDVNDQPSLISLSNSTLFENTDTTSGASVGTLVTSDVDIGETFTYSIVGGADAGVFSVGGAGSDELIITDGVLDFEVQNSYSVTVRTTDSGGLTHDQVLVISVTDQNEAPTAIAISNSTLTENTDTSGGFSVGTLNSTDVDAGETFSYSIVGGADAGVFSIGGAGSDELIITDGVLDFEVQNSYSVTVRTTDSGGVTHDQVLVISVTDQNEAPTVVAISNSTLAENTDTSGGFSVGTLNSTDVDAGETFSYSIVGGADAGVFSIGGAGSDELIITDGVLDFEVQNSYSVTVRTTDSGGLTHDQALVIAVTDQNEAPTAIAISNSTLTENTDTSGGFSVGTLNSTDVDAGETFSYSIVGGSDAGVFSIGGAGSDELIITDGVLDFEVKNSYSVTVRTTDSGGLTHDQVLVISVTDQNDAPTAIAISNSTLAENTDTSSGVSVGTLNSTDVDAGETFSYSIVGGADAGVFSIGGAGSDELIITDGLLDFEAQSGYSVTVRTTDSGGLTHDQALVISVTDQNEAPTVVAISNSTLAENTDTSSGVSVGTLNSTDVDAGETFTYSIVGGADAGVFSIGGAGSDELIITDGVLDFEVQNSYSVTVRTTDSGGLTHDQTLVIAVTDQNEAPTAIAISNSTLTESTDTSSGVSVGTLSSTDSDVGDTFTYSIVGGADAGVFSIGGASSDELIITDGVLDFEVQNSYSVTVRTTDSGGLTHDQALVIAVTDQNDAPTAIAISNSTLTENTDTSSGVSVGTLSSTDSDVGDTFTYSIVGGADAGVFSIGGASSDELIITDGVLDFEVQNSYSVTVRTTDSGGLTHDQVLVISVTDQNDAPTAIAISNSTLAENTDTSSGVSVGTLNSTDVDAGETFSYSIVGGADAGVFSIGGAGSDELIITDGVLDFEVQNSYSVTVRTTDSGGLTHDQALVIAVTDQNDAPTAIAISNSTLAENTDTSGGFSVGTLNSTDVDAGETFSYSIVGGADAGVFSIGGAGSDELIITDGVLDFEVKNSYSVTVRTTDSGGLTHDQVLVISVTDQNEAPTVVAISNSTLAENTDTSGGFSVGTLNSTDVDAGETFTYSIVGGSDAGVFSIGGAGSDELIITDGVLDFEVKNSYSVTVRTTDSGGLTHDQVLVISVTDQNDAPTAIAISNSTLAENTDTSGGFSVGTLNSTDVDAGETFSYSIVGGADAGVFSIGGAGSDELIITDGVLDFEVQNSYSVTVRTTDSGGLTHDQTLVIAVTDQNEAPTAIAISNSTLTESTDTSSGVSVGTLSSTDSDVGDTFTYSIVGGADAGVFSIGGAGSDELIITDGVLDFEVQNSYSVTVRTTDSGGLTHDQTLVIAVTDQNEAPTAIAISNSTLTESTDTSSGVSVGTLSSTDSDVGDTFTYSIVGGADAGVFSIGGAGSDELIITDGVLDFEVQNSYSVTVRTTDSGGLTHDQALVIAVTDQNDAPTAIAISNSTLTESTDTSSGVSVGTLSSTDSDVGDTFTYSIVGGADAGVFSIGGASSDELIITDGVLDFEVQNSYSVTVRTTDSGGLTHDQALVIAVTDQNDAPTAIAISNSTLTENTDTSSGVSVGTLSSTDSDVGDTFTYSIVGGADAGVFSIGGAGSDELIITDGVLDFEAQGAYSVMVRTTDSGGLTHDQALMISVTDQNEVPLGVAISNSALVENTDTSSGVSVGTLSSTDVDAGETFSYSIVGGADAGVFSVGGAGSDELIITDGVLDFEVQNSYSVTVRTTDSGGLTHDQALVISVTDQNEAPTAIAISNSTLVENTDTSSGVSVGTLNSTDVDVGETFTYSIVGGADAAVFSIGGVGSDELIITNGVLDVENQNSYLVTIRTTDSGGLTYDQALVLTVMDQNEAPSGVAISNNTLTENTDTTSGFAVGTLSSSDVDAGDTFTYSIVGGVDASVFTVGGAVSDELIITNGVLDFEAQNSYSVTVRTTDAGGQSHDQALEITVADQNEAPTDIVISNSVLAENTDTTGGVAVGTLTSADVDAGETFTYNIVGGADASVFSIGGVSSDELVIAAGILDFESQSSYTVMVRTTDAAGLSHDQTLVLTVIDENEAPTLISISNNVLDENIDTTGGVLVGVLSSLDPDAGESFTYSVVGGDDSDLFTVDENNPASLTIADGVLDFERQSSYEVIVRSIDSGTLMHDEQMIISLSDLNDHPSFLSDPVTLAEEGARYVYDVRAQDQDGNDAISIAAITLPDWLRLIDNGDGTASLSGTPSSIDIGDAQVSLQVTDGEASVNQIYSLTVSGSSPEIAPAFSDVFLDNDVELSDLLTSVSNQYQVVLQADSAEPEKEPEPESFSESNPIDETEPLEQTLESISTEFDPAVVNLFRVQVSSPHVANENTSTEESVLRDILKNWNLKRLDSIESLSEEERQRFYKDLQTQLAQLDNTATAESQRQKLMAQFTTGFSLTLSAGFVSWMLRAGSMVASLLASMPVWRQMDLLPILASDDNSMATSETADEASATETRDTNEVDEKVENILRK